MKRKLATILIAIVTFSLLNCPGLAEAAPTPGGSWGSCPVALTDGVLTVSAGVGANTGYGNPFTAWGSADAIVFEDGVVFPADCSALLSDCSFSTITFGQVDTSRVENMTAMFFSNEEPKIREINGLTSFDTSSVTSMQSMFAGCAFLETLDLSSFVISPSTDVSFMFEGCSRLRLIKAGSGFIWDPDMLLSDSHMWSSEADGQLYTGAEIVAQRAGIADAYTWPHYDPANYSQFTPGFGGVVTGLDDPNQVAGDPLDLKNCTHEKATWAMEVDAEDDHNSYFEQTDVQGDQYTHTITGHPVRILYCPECQQYLSPPTASEEYESYTEQHRWGYEWDPVLDDEVPSGICEVCGYQCQHEDLISYSVACAPTEIIGDDDYHSIVFPGATTDVVCRICGMSLPDRTAPARNDYRAEHSYENGVCTECGHVRSCTHPRLKEYLNEDAFVTYDENWNWLYGAPQYVDPLYHEVEGDVRTTYYCPDCGDSWEAVTQKKVKRSLPHQWHWDVSVGQFVCMGGCGATNPCQHSSLRHVEYLTGTGVTSDSYHKNDTHRIHSNWVFGDYCETCGLIFNVRTTFQTIEVPHTYDADGFCKECLHICTHTGDAVQVTVENPVYSDRTAAAHKKSWDVRQPATCPYCAAALGGQDQHVEEVQPHTYASSGVCTDCGYDLFAETAGLPVLSLPRDLKVLEKGAFDGSAAASVIVPDGCEAIGDLAFANCPELTIIRLPASVTTISASAFDACKDYVIVAPSGSAAIAFAESNGIQHVAE